MHCQEDPECLSKSDNYVRPRLDGHGHGVCNLHIFQSCETDSSAGGNTSSCEDILIRGGTKNCAEGICECADTNESPGYECQESAFLSGSVTREPSMWCDAHFTL